MSLRRLFIGMTKTEKTSEMAELVEKHVSDVTTVEKETTLTTYEIGFVSGRTETVKATEYKDYKGEFRRVDEVTKVYWSSRAEELRLRTDNITVFSIEDENVEYVEKVKEETVNIGASVEVEPDFAEVRTLTYFRTASVSYDPDVSVRDWWVQPRPDIPKE